MRDWSQDLRVDPGVEGQPFPHPPYRRSGRCLTIGRNLQLPHVGHESSYDPTPGTAPERMSPPAHGPLPSDIACSTPVQRLLNVCYLYRDKAEDRDIDQIQINIQREINSLPLVITSLRLLCQ